MTKSHAAVSLLIVAAIATTANAHTGNTHAGPDASASFLAGFLHPLTGLDHLLTMIGVGLWAAQLGHRARWIVPLAFLAAMSIGGMLAPLSNGIAEQGIIASLMALALLLGLAARLPTYLAAALVALFAVCHGHAHFAEMPHGNSLSAYAMGFVLSTAILHGIGVALGTSFQKMRSLILRLASGAVAIGGR